MSNKPIRNQRYRKGPNSTVEQVLEEIELGNLNGFYNTLITNEKMPTYEQAENETIIPRKRKPGNNSYIIFGKDRPADLSSGNGGRGLLGSNSIDIVVGLASSHKGQDAEYFDKDTMVGKNIFTDAARIYVSQRTDLDRHFGITEGKQNNFSNTKGSGIAVKADNVAILGRKTVTIRAGQAYGKNLGENGETDADGRKIDTGKNRIDFIGAQGLTLQPVVRGDELTKYLRKLAAYIKDNTNAILQLHNDVSNLRDALGKHTHITPSGPSAPSIELNVDKYLEMPADLLNIATGFNGLLQQTIDEINSLGQEDGIKLKENILSKTVFTT